MKMFKCENCDREHEVVCFYESPKWYWGCPQCGSGKICFSDEFAKWLGENYHFWHD